MVLFFVNFFSIACVWYPTNEVVFKKKHDFICQKYDILIMSILQKRLGSNAPFYQYLKVISEVVSEIIDFEQSNSYIFLDIDSKIKV